MAARGANLDTRLARLERAVEGLTPPGVFDVVQALPVARAGERTRASTRSGRPARPPGC